MRWNALDHADEYRAAAVQRRNRGLATGKAAAGHDFKRPDAECGTWARLLEETRVGWRHVVTEALAQYDWETRLQEVCHDCPF